MDQPLCRSVLITGANRGIGLGLVQGLLAASPCPEVVIATCRCPESAQELQELCKQYSNIRVLPLDVVSESSIKETVKEVEDIVGEKGLNCLINNAGINVSASLEDVTTEAMLRTFETNTVAQLMLSKAFLPLLKKAAKQSSTMGCHRAAIVNMSSISASIGLAKHNDIYHVIYPYRTSKAALNMVTKCLATDLKLEGILCIALHPGWIQTDMGGTMAPLKVQDTVPAIISLLAQLSEKDNGAFLDWEGKTLPW
ncbi:C-signal-like [Zootoca vivipara]|uniref:C-signal-like n=1 Tax=Zootoca vivipara TaxID=8524 RepID=UPI0015919058|nr:C-signal-like [Zootoca vivipara]